MRDPVVFRVELEDVGTRIDRLAERRLAEVPSRATARKAAKAGRLLLDGEPVESSRFVKEGQVVSFVLPPDDLVLDVGPTVEVVYTDPLFAVVHKPSGLSTNGWGDRTAERAAARCLAPVDGQRPRTVHRLDARTQGLLLLARTRGALVHLSGQFEARTVAKRYRALAIGRWEGPERLTAEIDGRAAETEVVGVEHSRTLHGEWLTTLDLVPHTGRRHQLRKHLAAAGHPVLGDVVYGLPGLTMRGSGLFLASVLLAFDHPATGERITVEIPEPAKFASHRVRETRRWHASHAE